MEETKLTCEKCKERLGAVDDRIITTNNLTDNTEFSRRVTLLECRNCRYKVILEVSGIPGIWSVKEYSEK